MKRLGFIAVSAVVLLVSCAEPVRLRIAGTRFAMVAHHQSGIDAHGRLWLALEHDGREIWPDVLDRPKIVVTRSGLAVFIGRRSTASDFRDAGLYVSDGTTVVEITEAALHRKDPDRLEIFWQSLQDSDGAEEAVTVVFSYPAPGSLDGPARTATFTHGQLEEVLRHAARP